MRTFEMCTRAAVQTASKTLCFLKEGIHGQDRVHVLGAVGMDTWIYIAIYIAIAYKQPTECVYIATHVCTYVCM